MSEQEDARAALAAAQERALARLASLEREFGGIVAAARDVGTDDEHDPEGATLAFERQHVAALAGRGTGGPGRDPGGPGPAGGRQLRHLPGLWRADQRRAARRPPRGEDLRGLPAASVS